MTREEAIQVLRDWDGYFMGHSSDDVNEALNMAIKALEQEPVLDKIRAEIEEIPKKYPMTMDYENGLKEALGIIDKYKTGK